MIRGVSCVDITVTLHSEGVIIFVVCDGDRAVQKE